jgi:uncharacterized protein (TIGR02118 family)
MVRLIVLYGTPINVQEFERHYSEVHIPLARQIPGVRNFTVSRGVKAIRGAEPYYLIVELDWDDMSAFMQAFQSPAGQATAQDVSDHLSRWCPDMRSMICELQTV